MPETLTVHRVQNDATMNFTADLIINLEFTVKTLVKIV